MKMLEWIASQYPGASRSLSFDEAYAFRRDTGGGHRAAMLFAETHVAALTIRPMPPWEYGADGLKVSPHPLHPGALQ